MNTSEQQVIAVTTRHCSACHAPILKRPYFHSDNGWFCDGCLAHYSIQELQVRIGRNKLHGRLYC